MLNNLEIPRSIFSYLVVSAERRAKTQICDEEASAIIDTPNCRTEQGAEEVDAWVGVFLEGGHSLSECESSLDLLLLFLCISNNKNIKVKHLILLYRYQQKNLFILHLPMRWDGGSIQESKIHFLRISRRSSHLALKHRRIILAILLFSKTRI